MDYKEQSNAVKAYKQTKDDELSTNLDVLHLSTTAVAESKSNGERSNDKTPKAHVCEAKQRILEEDADEEFAALIKAPNTGIYKRASDPVAEAVCTGFRM